MKKLILFGLFSIILLCFQGCRTIMLSISPYYLEPVKKETFITNFELVFNPNPKGELIETSAGKGNHTYMYSINEPFKAILEDWFTEKFGVNNGNHSNKIIVDIINSSFAGDEPA